MSSHFLLTEETSTRDGATCRRIQATRDLPHHGVTAGDLGGWVEKEDNLRGHAWVAGNARIYGDAYATDFALVEGEAEVYGQARVVDKASVAANAEVSDSATISGWARLWGNAWVFDNAHISGDARIYGHAYVRDDAQVTDAATVSDKANISGRAIVSNRAEITGTARVEGNAQITGAATVFGSALIEGDAIVSGDAEVFSRMRIGATARISNRSHIVHLSSMGSAHEPFTCFPTADGPWAQWGTWGGPLAEVRLHLTETDKLLLEELESLMSLYRARVLRWELMNDEFHHPSEGPGPHGR